MASVSKRQWTYKGNTREAWTVRYKDGTGAQRSKQFELKKQADAFRRKIEREIEDGEHVPEARSTTFKVACDEFMRNAWQRVRDGRIGRSRYEALRSSCEGKIVPAIGAKLVRDLKEADVEEFYGALITTGNLRPVSARTQVRHLKMVEDFAVKRGWTKTRPTTDALKALRGIKREPIRTFALDEVRHLVATAATRPFHKHLRPAAMLNCFVSLAAFCGLRRGEIGALSLDNVLLAERVVEVRRNLTEHRTLKGPKTRAGVRDVPVPAQVAEVLSAWIAQFYIPNPERLLFAGRDGKPLQLNLMQFLWTELLKRADLHHDERPFHFTLCAIFTPA